VTWIYRKLCEEGDRAFKRRWSSFDCVYDLPKSQRSAQASRTDWRRVTLASSAALTLSVHHATLLPASPAGLPGLPLSLLYLALVGRTDLNNLGRDGAVERRVAHSSLLEQIALFLRNRAVELAPGEGGEHGLEGLIGTVTSVPVRVEDREHLIRVDELLGEVAVDVALDQGLLGLHLEILSGEVDIDGSLDVTRGDLDLEDLTLVHRVDLVEDNSEALEGRASEGHAVDDLGSLGGDLVADERAVCLDVVTVVTADQRGVALVVEVERLYSRKLESVHCSSHCAMSHLLSHT
jgi:hypothetical protein